MESIVFEILPPPATWGSEKTTHYCKQIANMLRSQNILSVSIPEVVEEHRTGNRQEIFHPKIDVQHFATLLKHHHHALIPIPYKISVRMPLQEFGEWIEQIYEKGTRHLVIVGGEAHSIDYPGYTVIEAIAFIKKHYPEMKVGAITIFTRPGETERIIEKMKAGADFFFSQIIFEAANMKVVLLNLSRQCKKAGVAMPKIFLSLAIASKIKDIEFMHWLGVEFPSAVLAYLTEEQEKNVEFRSIEVMDMLLDEIFHFIHKEKIDVGFNIEHVMYSNLLLSHKLLKKIKQRIAEE